MKNNTVAWQPNPTSMSSNQRDGPYKWYLSLHVGTSATNQGPCMTNIVPGFPCQVLYCTAGSHRPGAFLLIRRCKGLDTNDNDMFFTQSIHETQGSVNSHDVRKRSRSHPTMEWPKCRGGCFSISNSTIRSDLHRRKVKLRRRISWTVSTANKSNNPVRCVKKHPINMVMTKH